MADPYLPPLSSFTLSALEQQAVAWALLQANPWGVDSLPKANLTAQEKTYCDTIKLLKDRIKAFHLQRQSNCCCYCGQSLNNRPIEQDREHIIPKGTQPELTFAVENLAVACKTCNMSVKGTKTYHLRGYRRGGLRDPGNILNGCNYNIPHPNIHDWEMHIRYEFQQGGRQVTVCHYQPLTRRGLFAYHFFRLDELEVFANTEEQRGVKNAQPLHPAMAALKKRYNQ